MNSPRILLLGRNGQVGWALQRALSIYGTLLAFDRHACDLADPKQVREIIRAASPQVIVNAAAYTAVDKAESESSLADRVNAEGPAILAEEAKGLGALLVHFSTDYVFDGRKTGAYVEADTPNPINAYGRSKLAGEQAVMGAQCARLVFRTSWVFGERGRNFPKTILGLAAQRDHLRIVADQVGAPTSADLIADVTSHCIARWLAAPSAQFDLSGLYHLAPAGEVSWHGLACEVIRMAEASGLMLKLKPDRIEPITSADYPTAARRPANSRLSTGKLAEAFGLQMPPWQFHLERFVSEYKIGRQ